MAIRFDASLERVDRTTGLPSGTSWTAMGWFKISVDRNAVSCFIGIGNANTSQCLLADTDSTGTRLNLYSLGNNLGSELQVGRWYHIAMVRDAAADAAYIYLNGRLDITKATPNTISWTSMAFGNDFAAWDDRLDGCAALCRFWDRYALSQSEIVEEMWSRRAVRRYGLYGDWPLDSHIDVQDRGGFGRHLTRTGTLATEPGPFTIERDRIGGRLSRKWLVIAASGPAAITGTGSMIVAPATISAEGAETFTGTAAETVASAAITGQAEQIITGTGALSVPAVTIDGQAAETFTGTAAETVAPAQISGSGATAYAATAAFLAPSVTLAGDGAETFTGTAAVQVASVQISGDGALEHAATGAVTVAPAQISGNGSVVTDITGTGAVASAPATISGSASLEFAATGAVEMPAATLSAAAVQAFSAQANVVAAMALLSGVGSLDFSGTASLTAAAVMLYAVATGGTESLMGRCDLSVAVLGTVLLRAAALGDAGLSVAAVGDVGLSVSTG